MKKPKEDEDQNLLFDIGDITRIIKILVKNKKRILLYERRLYPKLIKNIMLNKICYKISRHLKSTSFIVIIHNFHKHHIIIL